MNQKRASFFILVMTLVCKNIVAQKPIGIDEAIQQAYKSNGYVINRQLLADYRQQVIKTAGEIPATGIYADGGQINSIYFDTKAGIEQTFIPAKFSKAQKMVYEKEFQSAGYDLLLKKREIRRAVEGVFNDYRYQFAGLEMLQQIDSLYANSLRRMELRKKAGEDNIIDLSQAGINYNKIVLLKMQYRAAADAALKKFNLLLNTNAFVPDVSVGNKAVDSPPSGLADNHPILLTLQSQREIAIANQQLEKARLLPHYKIGYYNSSFRGMGPDGKTYTAADRMHGGSLTLQWPLFNRSQKEKIRAMQLQQNIASTLYDWEAVQIRGEISLLVEKYSSLRDMLESYRSMGMPNFKQVAAAADKQLAAGEINYMQWSFFMNAALENEQIKNDIIRQLGEVRSELDFLTQE